MIFTLIICTPTFCSSHTLKRTLSHTSCSSHTHSQTHALTHILFFTHTLCLRSALMVPVSSRFWTNALCSDPAPNPPKANICPWESSLQAARGIGGAALRSGWRRSDGRLLPVATATAAAAIVSGCLSLWQDILPCHRAGEPYPGGRGGLALPRRPRGPARPL